MTASANSEIANVIEELAPHVGEKKAIEYAIMIDEYSTEYKIDWKTTVAIIKQESDFIHGEISDDYRDFGISQFNWRTIRHKQLDLGRLLVDAEYAILETVKHLAFLKEKFYTGSKGHWVYYTRWNSYNPKQRRIYWYGTIEHKYKNGLKYKVRMITRILKSVRRQHLLSSTGGARPHESDGVRAGGTKE